MRTRFLQPFIIIMGLAQQDSKIVRMLFMRNAFILYRYVTIEFLKWFGLSCSFFFAAFFVNNILLLAKDILSKQVPIIKMMQLLFYTFPTILSYSFPLSVLLATIVVMVQYNTHNELLAMHAAGLSLMRCYIPIMFFSLLLTCLSFFMNDVLLPKSSVGFVRLYQDILFSTPGLELEPYSIRKYEGSIIATQEINQNQLYFPLIIQSNDSDDRRIIAGNTAQIIAERDKGVLTLTINDVQGHSHDGKNFADYDYFRADSLSYNVLLFALNIAIRPPTAREMRAIDVKHYLDNETARVLEEEMRSRQGIDRERFRLMHAYFGLADSINDFGNANRAIEQMDIRRNLLDSAIEGQFFDQEFRLYQTEYYRKFSLPLSCFFLTLFAFPVGAHLRKANWSVGFGIGLIASVLFWFILIGGQAIAIQRKVLPPLFVMFTPNIIATVTGSIVFVVKRVWK